MGRRWLTRGLAQSEARGSRGPDIRPGGVMSVLWTRTGSPEAPDGAACRATRSHRWRLRSGLFRPPRTGDPACSLRRRRGALSGSFSYVTRWCALSGSSSYVTRRPLFPILSEGPSGGSLTLLDKP